MEGRMKNYNIPNVEIIEGSRFDNYIVIHNDYVYLFQDESQNIVYLRCRIQTCGATSLIHLLEKGNGVFNCGKNHSHPPEIDYIKKVRFRRALRLEFQQNPDCNIPKLYNTIVARFGECFGLTLSTVTRFLLRYKSYLLESSPPRVGELELETDDNDELIYEVVEGEPVSNTTEEVFKTEIVEYKEEESDQHNPEEPQLPAPGNTRRKMKLVDRLPLISYIDLRDCLIPGVRLCPNDCDTLVHDNFAYEIINRKKYMVYLACKEENCSGTALIYLNEKGEGILKKNRCHNHPPDAETVNILLIDSEMDTDQIPNANLSDQLTLKYFGSIDRNQIKTPLLIEEVQNSDNCQPENKNYKVGDLAPKIEVDYESSLFTELMEQEDNQLNNDSHPSTSSVVEAVPEPYPKLTLRRDLLKSPHVTMSAPRSETLSETQSNIFTTVQSETSATRSGAISPSQSNTFSKLSSVILPAPESVTLSDALPETSPKTTSGNLLTPQSVNLLAPQLETTSVLRPLNFISPRLVTLSAPRSETTSKLQPVPVTLSAPRLESKRLAIRSVKMFVPQYNSLGASQSQSSSAPLVKTTSKLQLVNKSAPQIETTSKLQEVTMSASQLVTIPPTRSDTVSAPRSQTLIASQMETTSKLQSVTMSAPRLMTVSAPQSEIRSKLQSVTMSAPRSVTVPAPRLEVSSKLQSVTMSASRPVAMPVPRSNTFSAPRLETTSKLQSVTVPAPQAVSCPTSLLETSTVPRSVSVLACLSDTLQKPKSNTTPKAPRSTTTSLAPQSYISHAPCSLNSQASYSLTMSALQSETLPTQCAVTASVPQSEILSVPSSNIIEANNDNTNKDDWFATNAVGDIGEYLKKCNIPGVEILEGLRLGSLVLAYEGFVYLTKLRRGKKANLKCRVQTCAGTASVRLLPQYTGVITNFKGHTHRNDIDYINYLKFRKELRMEAIKSPLSLSCKQIFAAVQSRFRRNGITCNVEFGSMIGLIVRTRDQSKDSSKPESKTPVISDKCVTHNPPVIKALTIPPIESNLTPTNSLMEVDTLDSPNSVREVDYTATNPIKEDPDPDIPCVLVVDSDEPVSDEDTDSPELTISPTKPSLSLRNISCFSDLKQDLMRRNIPGTEKLEGFRLGGLIIVYKKHAYIISIQRKDIVYMRCRKKGCRGSAIIRLIGDDEGSFKCRQPHNHLPEDTTAGNLKFRHLLREESIRNPMMSSREIYNRVSAFYKGKQNVAFSTVESLMFRTRRRMKPPVAKSIPEIETILNEPQWSGHGTSYHMPKGQPWFRGSFTARDGTLIAVFINDCLRKTIHAFQPTVLHFDASYKTHDDVLKNHYMLSCHTVLKDKAFGFGFFLLSKKTIAGFNKCFELLQSYSCSDQLEPSMIYTDYEPSLQAAIRSTWPLSTTRGCFYHYAQAIIKKYCESNGDIQDDKEKKTVLKYFISLALLPPDEIVHGHLLINDMINDDESLSENFWVLNDYFCEFWLDQIGPQTFSVYDRRNRTNDSVELFHYKMKHALGARTSLWSFIDALRVLSHNEEANYLACIGGGNNKMPTKKVMHMKQDKALGNALKTLSKGLNCTDKLSAEEKEEEVKSVTITFMDAAAVALESLLDRELQEPKESKVTRPKRVLVSTSMDAVEKITEMQPVELLDLESQEYEPLDPESEDQEEEEDSLVEGIQDVAETVEVYANVHIGMNDQDNIEVGSYLPGNPLLSLLDHDYELIIQND